MMGEDTIDASNEEEEGKTAALPFEGGKEASAVEGKTELFEEGKTGGKLSI